MHPAARFLAATALPDRRIIVGVVGVLIVTVVVALSLLRPAMHPIQQGSAVDFWAIACNVTLPGGRESSNGPTAVRDGQCLYAVQGLHGQYLYRVPESEAMKLFPAVLEALEHRAASPTPADYAAQGYLRWKAIAEPSWKTPQMLFDYIADALVDKIRSKPRTYPLAEAGVITAREDFYRSIEKAHFYWATTLFEFLFLSALVIYAVAPLWRRRANWHLLAYWATVPFLFYLPFWLGYASRTRSPWGPCGGIVYPWLVWYSRLTGPVYADWERAFFTHMPPLLSPISQDPSGPILSLTGSSIPGPLYAFYGAIVLCVGAMCIMALSQRRRADPLSQIDIGKVD